MLRVVIALLLATSLSAATLPGVRVETLGSAAGFVTSLAVDSRGILYYTTTRGDLFRLDAGQSVRVARVETEAISNSGLLGMALIDDTTAAVHYTTPLQTHEVIATIDLTTGAETIVAKLAADASAPGRPTPPEHHGGNPTVADDGSIFVGIGDYGGFAIAQSPDWIAGKILRVRPDGRVE
ncbi:MAG TPA: PQQ-dependent sugar dehydrogenase, partial [Thermoanaerobaculia bacterium]|nr:PQQ-dependent sugar dehydrogenase [Thermoanaerobaculia bacterium]